MLSQFWPHVHNFWEGRPVPPVLCAVKLRPVPPVLCTVKLRPMAKGWVVNSWGMGAHILNRATWWTQRVSQGYKIGSASKARMHGA